MSDSIGSLARRAVSTACLLLSLTNPAAAQQVLDQPPLTNQFMSRYDFHLSAAGLVVDDDRFTWDTHFGGDFDFVDYVYGRMIFLADYQAVLGSEFRPFDPNQSNFTLAAAGSARFGQAEVVGALHHVSRHLGDRPKRTAIAWNEIDMRLLRRFSRDDSTIDLRLSIGKVIARAGVDYSWTSEADVTVRRPVGPTAGLFWRGNGLVITVTDLYGRGPQVGGRLEGGIRLKGQGGALELMAGFESVIDADPFDMETLQWFYGGFRLVTK